MLPFTPWGNDNKERARQDFSDELEKLRTEEERRKLRDRLKKEWEEIHTSKALVEQESAQREKQEQDKRMVREKAAGRIQKVFRGYRVRKDFVDVKLNDFVARKDPASYILEKTIFDVIRQDFAPDILVELCEGQYFPISATLDLRVHRAKYHLLESVICEMCRECAESVATEYNNFDSFWLYPETGAAHRIHNEVITECCQEVVQAVIGELLDDYFGDFVANDYLTVLLKEVIEDMQLVRESVEELQVDYVYSSLVDAELTRQIRRIAFELGNELNRKIYYSRRKKRKAKIVDEIVDKVVEQAMLPRILDHTASKGAIYIAWDASERMIDNCLADVILEHYSSLRFFEISTDAPSKTDTSGAPRFWYGTLAIIKALIAQDLKRAPLPVVVKIQDKGYMDEENHA
ncbi:hypothetical protein HDV05_000145 [Chytridiales sp. JEL 0842]|nr:hypothetical protein HDV05_000145 [Chytridiales sp. JEL 0842]